MIAVLFWLIFLLIYFLPTIVAYSRNHINALAIFILNLFLGYTLIAWVIAFVWAVYKQDPIKVKKVK